MSTPIVVFHWRIEDFSFPKTKIIDSPPFYAGPTAWHLRLFSSGDKLGSSIKRSTEGPTNIIASIRVSIVKNDGSEEVIQRVIEKNFLLDESCVYDGSGLEAEDFKNPTYLEHNNTLIILCRVELCNRELEWPVQYWATTRFDEDRLVEFDWKINDWCSKTLHKIEMPMLRSGRFEKIKIELIKEHNWFHVKLLHLERSEDRLVSITILSKRKRDMDFEQLLDEDETVYSIEDLERGEDIQARAIENFVSENVLKLRCCFSFKSIIENRITKIIYEEE